MYTLQQLNDFNRQLGIFDGLENTSYGLNYYTRFVWLEYMILRDLSILLVLFFMSRNNLSSHNSNEKC